MEETMKHNVRNCIILSVLLLALTGAAQESVLLKEDFSNYQLNQRPAGFNKNCLIKEEGGRKYLSYPGGYGLIFDRDMMTYLGAQKWRNLEVSFRFRFTDPKKTGFSLVLKSGGFRPEGIKYLLYYVGIMNDGVQATLQGAGKEEAEKYSIPKAVFAGKGLPLIEAGKWYKGKALVKDGSIEFLLEKDGRFLNVLSGNVLPGGGGIDFLTYNPVDLSDILVVEPK